MNGTFIQKFLAVPKQKQIQAIFAAPKSYEMKINKFVL